MDIQKIRSDFPMLRAHKKMQGHPLVFLDNASTTFKPDCVIDAMNLYYTEETCNSHRGDYDMSVVVDGRVKTARETVARFLNASPRRLSSPPARRLP